MKWKKVCNGSLCHLKKKLESNKFSACNGENLSILHEIVAYSNDLIANSVRPAFCIGFSGWPTDHFEISRFLFIVTAELSQIFKF